MSALGLWTDAGLNCSVSRHFCCYLKCSPVVHFYTSDGVGETADLGETASDLDCHNLIETDIPNEN